MLFMIFGAFYVVVRRPCCPGDHIDPIISIFSQYMAHGTFDRQRRPVRRPPPAAATAPAAASLSFAPSSMTTKPIQFNHCCARGGIFVVLFVVDDEDDTNSFMLRLRRRLCRSLCRRCWRRRYKFNHVGNQRGLPFIGLLQLGDQPRLLSIAWL